jgi:diadenosine tetraphosphate (Ap4A) HIT family hydrolase
MSTSSALSASCIFCKIIRGEIPSRKLAETAHSFAFLDVGPLSKGAPTLPPFPRAVVVG